MFSTKKKEVFMFRKAMFVVVLALTISMLLSTASFAAFNINLGGWAWNTYTAWFDLRGGQQPGTVNTFLASAAQVEEAALVCVNPGRWRQDVRQGMGGITLIQYTSSDDFVPFDDRGKFLVDQEFNYSVLEFATDIYNGGSGPSGCNPDQSYDLLYANCPEAFNAFNQFYGVSTADCRNSNWVPWEFLIKKLTLNGTILEDCSDPSNPSFETCTVQSGNGAISLYCTTDEEYRSWADDGMVDYYCSRQ